MRTLDDRWAIMICDFEMVIIEIIMEKSLPFKIKENSKLYQIILKDNLSRFLDFSYQLKQNKSAYGYEISTVDANDKATVMHFIGVELEGQYVVALFQNHFGFYEGMLGSKDVRVSLLKENMKAFYIETTDYNKLSELNNQILNNQRELAKKNSEIARLLNKTEEVNRALQEANATKDRIFSVIGHDLRAPLASVISCMNLMSMDQTTYEELINNNLFELLKHSVGNSLLLLENLLEWSRCQIGELTFNPVAFSLPSVMRDVITQYKDVASLKKINIIEDYLGEPIVIADQRMIGTVLRNLMSNAIKFSRQEGTIFISVFAEPDGVSLVVMDEGIGMSDEKIKGLFDPNINSVVSGTLGEKGFGFGLSLCQQFMDQNGGSILISSHLEEGSKFTIKFPLPIS